LGSEWIVRADEDERKKKATVAECVM
jgi:hypothetical protein